MNTLPFQFRGETLHALASGALFWTEQRLLCVSDLHLGKSDRIARRNGAMLPPYETLDTLDRLDQDIAATAPSTVICLGDSFDDLAAGRDMAEALKTRIVSLMAGRRWIWIEGNHDPGPLDFGGTHLAEFALNTMIFRHIAEPDAEGEISGHYHPKARVSVRGRSLSRRCLLLDDNRMILPAYGTYTGGLFCDHPDLSGLFDDPAHAILVGPKPVRLPMPRQAGQSSRPAARRSSR